jgi:hypothetical protein
MGLQLPRQDHQAHSVTTITHGDRGVPPLTLPKCLPAAPGHASRWSMQPPPLAPGDVPVCQPSRRTPSADETVTRRERELRRSSGAGRDWRFWRSRIASQPVQPSIKNGSLRTGRPWQHHRDTKRNQTIGAPTTRAIASSMSTYSAFGAALDTSHSTEFTTVAIVGSIQGCA